MVAQIIIRNVAIRKHTLVFAGILACGTCYVLIATVMKEGNVQVVKEMKLDEQLHWNKLPPNLGYLAAPAEKYGQIQFEDRIIDFLRQMSEKEKAELTALLKRATVDSVEIESWINQHPIMQHAESRLVEYLMHLLAIGNDGGFFLSRKE